MIFSALWKPNNRSIESLAGCFVVEMVGLVTVLTKATLKKVFGKNVHVRYDLKCIRRHETLYVEVKGEQTIGKRIILTTGELEFVRRHSKHMILFILHSIRVSRDRKKLSNGFQVVVHP